MNRVAELANLAPVSHSDKMAIANVELLGHAEIEHSVCQAGSAGTLHRAELADPMWVRHSEISATVGTPRRAELAHFALERCSRPLASSGNPCRAGM